jgi:disulfide bond formation protein DsbB
MGEQTPNRSSSYPLIPALIMFLAVGVLLALLLREQPRIPPTVRPTAAPIEAAQATEAVIAPTVSAEQATEAVEATEAAAPAGDAASFDPQLVAEGQTLYQTTCMACHGIDARGVPNLGKDLLASEFVHGLTDQELHNFIVVGRQPWDEGNTTGVAMPPRGGNPALSDEDIDKIVVFLRANAIGGAAAAPVAAGEAVDATEAPAVAAAPTQAPELVSAADFVLPVVALGFTDDVTPEPLPEREFNAAQAYALSCSGCHGAQGEGVATVAQPLGNSAIIADDEAYFNFLVTGQTEVEMTFPHPVRGEYPALDDDQLRALIEYTQTLEGA